MSEFSIKYDRGEGTFRISIDLEGKFVLIPVIQDSAVIWRDLSRIGIGLLSGLAAIPQSVLEARKA